MLASMRAVEILAHALSIVHGAGAGLACVAFFYLGGIVLVPRRWDQRLGLEATPAVLGAAVYVLLCWVGVTLGVPVAHVAIGFAAAVLALAIARYRWLGTVFSARAVFAGATLGWLSAFGVLYVLAYLFTMPPATPDYLPPAWTGNVDLLTYVGYTKYVLRLGPSNLVGFTYLNFVYLQTPAVFYLLGGVSLFFGQDPLSAAMPAQFALTALSGIAAAHISRSVFNVPRAAALGIAGILISGPFYRYVAGAYFLSTLMATPILLYLLWTTVACRSQRLLDAGLAIRFGSAYVLLLLIYPFLLFVGLAAQLAVIVLMLADGYLPGGPARRDTVRHAGRTICAVLVPLGLLALCVRQPADVNRFSSGPSAFRLAWSIETARALSEKGVAGWPLDLISPLAVLGWPGTVTGRIQVENPAHRGWALAAFCAVASALGLLYFRRFRRHTTPAQRCFAGLAGGSFVAYCAYFSCIGASYQQWKFASYTALPLSFVVYAGGLQLFRHSAASARLAQTAWGHRAVRALPVVVAVGLVVGNLLVHTVSDPDLMRIPGAMRNIAMVDALPFRELSVQMMDDPGALSTRIALYFLPTKTVHVVSSYFQPSEPLSFEHVSRLRPLLIQNYGCEGVGHDDTMTILGVGCLLLGPPSLALDTPYPFSRSFLFVDFEGLSARGPEGRWTRHSNVRLTLTADLRRIRIHDGMHINLLLDPHLPPGTMRRRLVFSWGANRHAEASLDSRQWVSLPVQGADWTGNSVWTLPIWIELPDEAESSLSRAPARRAEDRRPLAVLFEELSISASPGG